MVKFVKTLMKMIKVVLPAILIIAGALTLSAALEFRSLHRYLGNIHADEIHDRFLLSKQSPPLGFVERDRPTTLLRNLERDLVLVGKLALRGLLPFGRVLRDDWRAVALCAADE